MSEENKTVEFNAAIEIEKLREENTVLRSKVEAVEKRNEELATVLQYQGLDVAQIKDWFMDPRFRDMADRLTSLENRFVHPSERA